MLLYRCKKCGITLQIADDEFTTRCKYCNEFISLPQSRDEQILKLYEQANHLFRNGDYNEAIKIFQQIQCQKATDSETYWSIVLCKFGVKYFFREHTKKTEIAISRIPSISILNDTDYLTALKYATNEQAQLYRGEAEKILYATLNKSLELNASELITTGYLHLKQGNWQSAGLIFDKILNSDSKCDLAHAGKLLCELYKHDFNDLSYIGQDFENNFYYKQILQSSNDHIKSAFQLSLEHIKSSSAYNLMEQGQYAKALKIYENNMHYINNSSHIKTCKIQIQMQSIQNLQYQLNQIKQNQYPAIQEKIQSIKYARIYIIYIISSLIVAGILLLTMKNSAGLPIGLICVIPTIFVSAIVWMMETNNDPMRAFSLSFLGNFVVWIYVLGLSCKLLSTAKQIQNEHTTIQNTISKYQQDIANTHSIIEHLYEE